MVFDYSSLPREFSRRYLPQDLKFEWSELSKLYEELAGRNLGSLSDLERWLADESELDAYTYEQRTIRYINSTRQTDNPDFTLAYERYTEELEPRLKVAKFGLLQKYAASQFRSSLPRETYGLEDLRRKSALSIFRPENVELERTESTLAQKYQRTVAAMTVNYRGQERTLQQMSKFYEEPERRVREEAWRMADQRALADKGTLDVIYDQMVKLRDEEARNAGFDNFRDYIFVKKDRFDYTPSDCIGFHRAVEEYLVPLSREIDKEKRERLGVDTLRPWDLRVDPGGRQPLSPFEDATGLVRGAAKVVEQIDGKLSSYFGRMSELELLDLESRKGKAPGGYQEELTELKLPFIFMNAAKRDNDVRTLLHECGHSFHTFLMRDEGLPYFNGGANLPLEFAEVASISMEIISGEHYQGTFYNEQDARRSNWEEAVGNVKLFTWVATIDAFQHWVYTHPDHSHEERAKAWVDTFNRFSGLESYEGLEASRAYRWQRQLHLFEVPFYYIEYGIALTGALGIWTRYRRDRRAAIESYKDALSLGASRSLPELFRAAGLEWDLGPRTLNRLADELRSAVRGYS
ncbi:MAG TPA: M3 family oligoendopeptidase [Nitrososphaerales archaeon]|nr:M3 family oligoendopeptidase [Nitrososphaerales archaeon]